MYQMFSISNVEEIQDLPIPASPWHTGGIVSILLEHWNVLIEYSKTLDPKLGSLLADCGEPQSYYHANYTVAISNDDLRFVINFINLIKHSLESTTDLVPEPTEILLEDYTNYEYIRMLAAIQNVLQTALQLNVSFDAWIE